MPSLQQKDDHPSTSTPSFCTSSSVHDMRTSDRIRGRYLRKLGFEIGFRSQSNRRTNFTTEEDHCTSGRNENPSKSVASLNGNQIGCHGLKNTRRGTFPYKPAKSISLNERGGRNYRRGHQELIVDEKKEVDLMLANYKGDLDHVVSISPETSMHSDPGSTFSTTRNSTNRGKVVSFHNSVLISITPNIGMYSKRIRSSLWKTQKEIIKNARSSSMKIVTIAQQ